jgi:TetR/AcrR family transcriptional repressor of bet genes
MAIAAKRTRTIIARRQDLIQGTIKSIGSLGYNNSTVQTICEAAGVSRGLIGHYFKGKDDLLIEAFRHLCARADEDTRQAIRAVGDDPLRRLLAATAVTFGSATSRENALVWLACCGAAPWNKSMMELHNRLYRRYRAWIERMMEQAAKERGVEIDAKRAALAYAQMVDGFWIGWLMDKDAYSLQEATEIVSDWVLGLFGERSSVKRKGVPAKPTGASPARRPRKSGAAAAPQRSKSWQKPART